MTSVSAQFYALPGEILDVINSCRLQLGLSALLCSSRDPAAGRRFPDASEKIGEDDVRQVGERLLHGQTEILLFTGGVPDAATRSEFQSAPTLVGSLAIGRNLTDRVEESSFGILSDDQTRVATTRKIANAIKRVTKAGMIGRHPDTGAEAIYRAFRYSPGAEGAYQAGKTLTPLVGKVQFRPAP